MKLLIIFLGLSSILLLVGAQTAPGPGVGVNWGTQVSHSLPPDTVVRLLKDNGIRRVKLFDAEYDVLRALGGSGIDVMVGIPNEMLFTLANSLKAAEKWVSQNVSKHLTNDGTAITYVAVGNEPFLSTYNGSFLNTTFPALLNVQAALVKAGLQQKIKVTCPLNADVYESSNKFPSTGDFRADIRDLMIAIVKFLADTNSAFTVNIYPFLSLYLNPDFPVEYAFFDGNATPLTDGVTSYYNVFDANYDTLVHALQKNGFGALPIIIGEIGWPTDGDRNANAQYAQRFNQGFMQRIVSGKGTPMRPDPINAYLFSLIDEDAKSVQPGNFERHWGIFTYDGFPKYNLNLATANSGNLVRARDVSYQEKKWCIMRPSASLDDPSIPPSVSYACGLGDCTSLGYGTSCSSLDARGNISYAFNSYYQIHDQLDGACKFNVSTVTKVDPTTPSCRFPVMIQPYYGGAEQQLVGCYKQRLSLVVALMLFLLTCI